MKILQIYIDFPAMHEDNLRMRMCMYCAVDGWGCRSLPFFWQGSEMANFLARVLRSPVGGRRAVKAHTKAVSVQN